jgi:hypothetical protein
MSKVDRVNPRTATEYDNRPFEARVLARPLVEGAFEVVLESFDVDLTGSP